MNKIPIKKISLASFAFMVTNFSNILKISLIPFLISIPFIFIVIPDFIEILTTGKFDNIQVKVSTIVYILLFIYAYVYLSISIYRLTVLGPSSVNWLNPVIGLKKIALFLLLAMIIGVLNFIPVMMGVGYLQLLVYFIIIPIVINYIHIAIDKPIRYNLSLPFYNHVNLFILQAFLPALIGMSFVYIIDLFDYGYLLALLVQIVVTCWTLINLGLCYKVMNASN
jgi:hypothetical protein